MDTVPKILGEIVPAPLDAGVLAVNEVRLTRDHLAARWLAAQRSPNTRVAYERDLRDYFAWCDGNGVDVFTARRTHIDLYRHWLEHDDHEGRYPSKRRYTDTTIARKLTAVSSFYRFVSIDEPDLVQGNPVAHVRRPTLSDESMTVGLDIDQSDALLAAAEKAGRMEHAIVMLLLSTGLRVSEVCTADTGDLGRERGHRTLNVTRKGRKRQRVVVSEDASDAIDAYLAGRAGPLFIVEGVRINRRQIGYLVKRLGIAAGIGDDVHPHRLRHTATTQALDEDVPLRDVQVLMGHRDPRTTTRYDQARSNIDRSPVHAIAAAYRAARERRQQAAGGES